MAQGVARPIIMMDVHEPEFIRATMKSVNVDTVIVNSTQLGVADYWWTFEDKGVQNVIMFERKQALELLGTLGGEIGSSAI